MTTEETASLVIRLQSNDNSAFNPLFDAYRLKAVRTAAFISGDYALAEDITQEAFVKCLLNIKSLREPEKFKPWFFRLLTRCAWRAMDKKNRLIPSDEIFEIDKTSQDSVFDCYPSEQLAQYANLYNAIKALGKKQRTTIILYYFNEFSIKEIAMATSSLEATVKSRLHMAKKSLKKSLGDNSGIKEELAYEK